MTLKFSYFLMVSIEKSIELYNMKDLAKDAEKPSADAPDILLPNKSTICSQLVFEATWSFGIINLSIL